ncbi:MAG TPA: ABC transporter substrate-binding protein [Chloroflexota bacterium]
MLRGPALMLLSALLGACGSAGSAPPPASAPQAATPVQPAAGAAVSAAAAQPTPAARDPLRVVYVTRNGAMAPMWIAHEAGIFARYGLDTEMVYISSGTLGMQALLAKEVDIGVIAASAAIAASLSGADAIYVGAIQRTFGLWIFAQPEIATPADLRGKRVGITRRNSTTDVALGYYLDKYGLAPDRDVLIAEAGDQAAMLPAMATGALNAAVLSDPATFEARKQGYRELADLTQLGVEYPQSALTTTRSLAAARPDVVERFLRAVYEGTHRFKTDRALALEVLAKYLQTDDAETLSNTYATYAGQLVQDVPRANYAGTQTILNELAATNEAARGADPARFLDLSFTAALDREGLEAKLYGR